MKKLLIIAMGFFLLTGATTAQAIPELQLYIEGSTYAGSGSEPYNESWVLVTPGSTIRLWTIGDVDAKGELHDVTLSIAYPDDSGSIPVFTLTPSTTGGYNGVTDPSIPNLPTYLETRTDGSSPVRSDGSNLPSHGVYGAGTSWQEFALGNFSLTDSPIGDYITSFPTSFPDDGQINVYDLTLVSGLSPGDWVHFDLYGYYLKRNGSEKATNAPFSHDATADISPPVENPEPCTMLLVGSGLVGVAGLRKRFKR